MLSNTAVPKYYGQFRDAVVRGEIPVCEEISCEMNRIDALIANPEYYYDDKAVEGFIAYCENELTLSDGADLHLLDSFKLWAEQLLGWYYFEDRQVFVPYEDGVGGRYETKTVKKRLTIKQYLIVARGAAKSMYMSLIQNYFMVIDTTTTHQIATAPTMKQAEEVMGPFRTAITRARGPLYKFLRDPFKIQPARGLTARSWLLQRRVWRTSSPDHSSRFAPCLSTSCRVFDPRFVQ